MEIYSTTLWHLRQESALSYLAHEVTAADRSAPESWCVVGNCFSLQKEHDSAVKFLERAVQLDPSFAYVAAPHPFNNSYARARARVCASSLWSALFAVEATKCSPSCMRSTFY